MTEKPHIGKLIKAKLDEQGRRYSWLAEKLGYTRSNMYKIFENERIDTDLLIKISQILGCDFFAFYSEYLNKNENK